MSTLPFTVIAYLSVAALFFWAFITYRTARPPLSTEAGAKADRKHS